MAPRPVNRDEVEALYRQWVDAGRPSIREFARLTGKDETTARR